MAIKITIKNIVSTAFGCAVPFAYHTVFGAQNERCLAVGGETDADRRKGGWTRQGERRQPPGTFRRSRRPTDGRTAGTTVRSSVAVRLAPRLIKRLIPSGCGCARTFKRTRMCTRTSACVMCAYVCVRVCLCACVRACVCCVCVHPYVCVCMRLSYTHNNTYTYIFYLFILITTYVYDCVHIAFRVINPDIECFRLRSVLCLFRPDNDCII